MCDIAVPGLPAHKDFMDVSAQLYQMSTDDCQKFVNYLSARLRLIASVMYRRQWAGFEAGLLIWFQSQAIQELTNAIIVHGVVSTAGKTIETPPYLKACTRGTPHLSRRVIEDNVVADGIDENGLQFPDPHSSRLSDHDEWYMKLPARTDVPTMDAVLTSWSRHNLDMREQWTLTNAGSLSNEQLLALKNFLTGYQDLLTTHYEKHVAKYDELLDEREKMQTLLIEAERMEQKDNYRKLAKSMLENYESDSSTDEEDLERILRQPLIDGDLLDSVLLS